jgi:hypothetical protein
MFIYLFISHVITVPGAVSLRVSDQAMKDEAPLSLTETYSSIASWASLISRDRILNF